MGQGGRSSRRIRGRPSGWVPSTSRRHIPLIRELLGYAESDYDYRPRWGQNNKGDGWKRTESTRHERPRPRALCKREEGGKGGCRRGRGGGGLKVRKIQIIHTWSPKRVPQIACRTARTKQKQTGRRRPETPSIRRRRRQQACVRARRREKTHQKPWPAIISSNPMKPVRGRRRRRRGTSSARRARARSRARTRRARAPRRAA